MQDKWRKWYAMSDRVMNEVEAIWATEEEWDQLLRDVDAAHVALGDKGRRSSECGHFLN
jgi:hypothetical protein